MLWSSSIVISLHAFLVGYALSSLGPCLKEGAKGSILADIHMSTFIQQVATAATILGAFIGCFLASGPATTYGVKKVLRVNCIFWIAGGVMCAFPISELLIAGRFVLGLGVGVTSATSPVLLSELAPDELRGTITSLHQLQITIGILFSGLVSYGFVSYVTQGWRYITAFPLLLGALLLLLDAFVPNSPIWLVRQGRLQEAKATISLLRYGEDVTAMDTPSGSLNRGDNSLRQSASFTSSVVEDPVYVELEKRQIAVEDAVHRLERADEEERLANSAPVSWAEVFSYKKAVVIGLGLMFFQPMSGINAVIFYSTKIFGFAGVKEDILATVSVGVINVIMTVVSMYAVERAGRKVLLVGGTAVCTLALFVLGFSLLALNGHPDMQGNMAVGMALLYVACFAVGMGAVAWVVLSEVLPTRVRSKAFSLFVAESWVLNLIIAMLTLTTITALGGGDSDAQQKEGVGWLFIIFACVCILGTAFFALVLPETKGLSEATIQSMLRPRPQDQLIIRSEDGSRRKRVGDRSDDYLSAVADGFSSEDDIEAGVAVQGALEMHGEEEAMLMRHIHASPMPTRGGMLG